MKRMITNAKEHFIKKFFYQYLCFMTPFYPSYSQKGNHIL